MKKLALLSLLVTLSSCASQQVQDAKPYLSSAEEVLAELLCSQVNADKAGVSLEQARNTYCSTRDLWLPFLQKALEVKSGAASLDAAKASFAKPADAAPASGGQGGSAGAVPVAAGAPAAGAPAAGGAPAAAGGAPAKK